jgi:hypothetical protein
MLLPAVLSGMDQYFSSSLLLLLPAVGIAFTCSTKWRIAFTCSTKRHGPVLLEHLLGEYNRRICLKAILPSLAAARLYKNLPFHPGTTRR